MTDEEEHRLARDMAREFGLPERGPMPITSGASGEFLESADIICGQRPADCALTQEERLHLLGLLYAVRCLAVRMGGEAVLEQIGEQKEIVVRHLVARGGHLKAAVMIAERADIELTVSLVALVNDVGRWPDLERW